MVKVTAGNPLGTTISTQEIEDSAITNAKMAANSVDTANIVDDAVTLAKLAHGTAGKLVGFDASGVPSEVSGSGWTFVESKVVSGGAISSFDFAATLDGDTDKAYMMTYRIVGDTTTNPILRPRINGSIITAGPGVWMLAFGSTLSGGTDTDTYIAQGDSSSAVISGTITLPCATTGNERDFHTFQMRNIGKLEHFQRRIGNSTSTNITSLGFSCAMGNGTEFHLFKRSG